MWDQIDSLQCRQTYSDSTVLFLHIIIFGFDVLKSLNIFYEVIYVLNLSWILRVYEFSSVCYTLWAFERFWERSWTLFCDCQVEELSRDQGIPGIETMPDHLHVVILRFPDLGTRRMASSPRVGGQTVVYWTRSFDWPDFDVEVRRGGLRERKTKDSWGLKRKQKEQWDPSR